MICYRYLLHSRASVYWSVGGGGGGSVFCTPPPTLNFPSDSSFYPAQTTLHWPPCSAMPICQKFSPSCPIQIRGIVFVPHFIHGNFSIQDFNYVPNCIRVYESLLLAPFLYKRTHVLNSFVRVMPTM